MQTSPDSIREPEDEIRGQDHGSHPGRLEFVRVWIGMAAGVLDHVSGGSDLRVVLLGDHQDLAVRQDHDSRDEQVGCQIDQVLHELRARHQTAGPVDEAEVLEKYDGDESSEDPGSDDEDPDRAGVDPFLVEVRIYDGEESIQGDGDVGSVQGVREHLQGGRCDPDEDDVGARVLGDDIDGHLVSDEEDAGQGGGSVRHQQTGDQGVRFVPQIRSPDDPVDDRDVAEREEDDQDGQCDALDDHC